MNRWMNRDHLLAHQFPAGIKELVLAAFFGMAVLGMGSPALAGRRHRRRRTGSSRSA